MDNNRTVCYRIYTEDLYRADVQKIVGDYFDGFTLLSGDGVWKGALENALVIEIVTERANEGWIRELSRRIRQKNQQESVLVTRQDVDIIDIDE
jgi:hypothetical protein